LIIFDHFYAIISSTPILSPVTVILYVFQSISGNINSCTLANVLCEKTLLSDARLCVKNDNNAVDVNATVSVTFTRRFTASVCIEFCRGIADFKVRWDLVIEWTQ
jgi:hypothetical protein